MEYEIDLRDIFFVLWKSRFLIIGIFVIAVLVAGVMSFAIMSPTYKSSSIVALGNFGDPIYTSQDSAIAIMCSDEYLIEVIEELNFEVPPEEFWAFKDSIDIVAIKGSSNLLLISAETKEVEEGEEIVETIIRLFDKKSKENYIKYKTIISNDLTNVQYRLEVIESDLSQTREVLKNLEDGSETETANKELRISRTLDLLQGEESRRSSLLDRELELQKQLTLLKQLEVIQETKKPVAAIEPKRILMVEVAGMLGLIIGIFAAFLREGLRRSV